MAKATKQAKKQAESAVPYIRRVLEDERLQEQLRSAAGGLRGAYSRARGQGGKAVEDKRLYDNLRQAATSIRQAATGLQKPKPEPKRRMKKVAAVVLASGSALLVAKQQKSQSK